MRLSALVVLSALMLAGCDSKAHKMQQLQEQYNAANRTYQQQCAEDDSAGAARMLTGEKLTAEQMATLEAKKKEQQTRCKPLSDHLAEIQRQIFAAQQ